jgi:putative copper resistance protein D
MSMLYYATVTLHLLAALVWLGGMFFLGLVGAPVLRSVEPAMRQQLFQQLGVRFRSLGWLAFAVLIITGVASLHFRGRRRWNGVLAETVFWRSGFGQADAIMLFVVGCMFFY